MGKITNGFTAYTMYIYMTEMRNAYQTLDRKLEGKRPFAVPVYKL